MDIKDALSKLDPNENNHWTADGLPRLDTVKFLAADQTLTRESVSAAAPEFNRAFAQAQAANAGPQAPAVAGSDTSAEPVANAAPPPPSGPTPTDGLPPQLADTALSEEPDRVSFLESELSDLNSDLRMIQGRIKEVQTELDALYLQREKEAPAKVHTTAAYLASQCKILEERAGRLRAISESGIDLKHLARSLRSPLDEKLRAKRK